MFSLNSRAKHLFSLFHKNNILIDAKKNILVITHASPSSSSSSAESMQESSTIRKNSQISQTAWRESVWMNLKMFCILGHDKQNMSHFSPPKLLLHVELPMRATFLLSMERREARRTDSCVILCRKPAREWRILREHRTELLRELWAVPAIAIFAAVRPGECSSFLMSSADKRSVEETLTTTSGEGTLLRGLALLHSSTCSTSALFTSLFLSTSSSSTSSGFLFRTSSVAQLPRGDWLTSSATSGFVCLFLRVVRFGCVVVLPSEVEASGMVSSSVMKFSDLREEPRRLLRFPFENLDSKGTFLE